MSSTDDASSRLSNALDEIFSGGVPTLPHRDGETPDEPADPESAEPEPTSQQPAVEPEPAVEPAPEPEPVVEPEPTSEQPAPEAEPVVEPAPTATAEQPAPEAEPVVEPAPTATAEPSAAQPTAASEPPVDWSVDDDVEAAEEYELPEIVPATNPVPLPVAEPAAPPAPAPALAVAPAPAPAVAPAPAPAVAPAPAPAAPATSWADHMGPASVSTGGAPLRAPGRRPRVRRVTRVLRHIDPWSTFKVALVLSVVAYVVTLTAGVLLWRVADDTGTLANVERWFTQFGWETFELKGGEIFHNAWIIGLFGVVAMTGGLVLLATLFNLVSDIVGGVRMTVLEEEVVERTVSSTRRYVVRRGPAEAGAAGVAAQDWDVDGDDAAGSASAPTADWSVDDEPSTG